MNATRLTLMCLVSALLAPVAMGREKISGEYIEARTCDVYTGPCFANGEVGISGREALIGWMVDQGSWNGHDVSGLGVALVVRANDTLGFGGSFLTNPSKITAVLLVDERADAAQQAALRSFVESSASHLTESIVSVQRVPISLQNDHLSGKGKFRAGNFAEIETRKLRKSDCVCSNETVFYPPLTDVENSHPVYTLAMDFQGDGLGKRWKAVNRRSAFLATFSR